MPLRSPADFTHRALVLPELRNQAAPEAVDELCSALHREGKVRGCSSLREAIIRREQVSSTKVAPGWALPHARIPGAGELCFAFGRCAEGLRWFGSGETPVRILFLFVVPESEARTYLLLISALSRLSQNLAKAEELLRAPDAKEIIRVLGQVHLREPNPVAIS